MSEWFEQWFDEDYAQLYAHRDEAEAKRAVATAFDKAPELTQGPVLDLACGGGRHLDVMRVRNPQAFGLDLSAVLLRQASQDLKGHLLRGDMRHLPLQPHCLSGVCLWFTPFGYFDDVQNSNLLKQLHTLLRPGGVLLMDYLNAAQVKSNLVTEDTLERNGIRIHSHRRIEGHRIVKEMQLTRLGSGETRQALESVRIYEPDELVALSAKAGFTMRLSMGDYTGATFTSESPRWIGIFES